jgi:hypothetical protein
MSLYKTECPFIFSSIDNVNGSRVRYNYSIGVVNKPIELNIKPFALSYPFQLTKMDFQYGGSF